MVRGWQTTCAMGGPRLLLAFGCTGAGSATGRGRGLSGWEAIVICSKLLLRRGIGTCRVRGWAAICVLHSPRLLLELCSDPKLPLELGGEPGFLLELGGLTSPLELSVR